MTSGDSLAALVAVLLVGVWLMRLYDMYVLRRQINKEAAAIERATKSADAAEEAYDKARSQYDANHKPGDGGPNAA